jgi:hypothetical protein
MENKDLVSVLDSLANSLHHSGSLQQVYLDSLQEMDHSDTIGPDVSVSQLRISEGRLPRFLQQAGIRSMTLNDIDNIDKSLATVSIMAQDIQGSAGSFFRNASLASHLRSIFKHCRTIAFTDWALFANASDSWDALLTEVIKPLHTRDMEFIFYLGNVSSIPVFLVDEMLDIMGDFSRYGRVTFSLDQQEMVKLWESLNGVKSAADDSWPFDYEARCMSLFNTMNVHRMLVYASNGVSLFMKEQRFNLSRQVLASHIENGAHARNDFINGYCMGLSLGLDIALCIALGVVFYAVKGEKNMYPNREMLLNYIRSWREQPGSVSS